MERVDQWWYKSLYWFITAASILIAAAFPVLQRSAPHILEISGFTLASTVGAIIVGFYGVVLWPFIQKHSLRFASLLSLIGFATLSGIIIYQTGGMGSVYIILWLLVVIVAGMFGRLVLGGCCLLSTIFFAYLTYPFLADISTNDIVRNLIILGLSYLGAGLSVLFWRQYYLIEEVHRPVQDKSLGNKLQTEQLKSDFLINAITDGVVVVDGTGRIQLSNPAAADMLGWHVSEMAGLDYRSVFHFFAKSGAEIIELNDDLHPFEKVLRSGDPLHNFDSILTTRSQTKQIIVSLSVSPLYKSAHEYNGVIAIFRDVSMEKVQERQRSEFISTASHEMRTPVAAIEGYISLALNEKVSQIDDKAREYLTKAHEATQHLGQLFRDLLAIAKSEDGRLENHPQVIELGSFLERIVEDSRFIANQKGLQLAFLVATQTFQQSNTLRPLYYIYADTERIREVLANLLSNAIKFTQSGSITIGLHGEESFVQISVKDNGIGIPAEDIPHLFQKFYRVDNSSTRTIGGTGLGLYLCRKIVELYKGQIWVESEFGKGSTFFINLPRLSTAEAQEQLEKEAATQTQPPPTTPPPVK